eukprot:4557_1
MSTSKSTDNSSRVSGYAPSRFINRSSVPTRSDITKKKRTVHRKISNDIDDSSQYFGKLKSQQRMIFDVDKMQKEFAWFFIKSNHKKNENKSICTVNKKAMDWCSKSIQRLNMWTENELSKPMLGTLRNCVDIIVTKPQHLHWLIQTLNNEHDYQCIAAPLAYCLGFWDFTVCNKHPQIIKEYKQIKQYDKLICRKCGKDATQSVWTKSSFRYHNHRLLFLQWLQIIYENSLEIRQKNITTSIATIDAKHIGLALKHMRETILRFERKNPVVCGGNNMNAYHDHKENNKLKHGHGYIKTSNTKVLVTTDDVGLLRHDVVSNERAPQTEYMIQKQSYADTNSITDEAKTFIGIPKLAATRTHKTVKHKGQMAPGGYISFFKDENTGIHNNPAEGAIGRLQHHVIRNPTMNRNESTYKQHEALYSVRHNRTCNFGSQIFVYCLIAQVEIHPPNKPSLCRKEYEDYSNVYVIEKIIDKRKYIHNQNEDEYLVKWKQYGHRDNTWVPSSAFQTKDCINEYNALNLQQKQKILRDYNTAIKKESINAKKRLFIAGLSKTKMMKHITLTNIWKNGKYLYEQGHVTQSRMIKHQWIAGKVTSQRDEFLEYGVAVKYDKYGNICPEEMSCQCFFWKKHKTKLCKHLCALLYERLINKNR